MSSKYECEAKKGGHRQDHDQKLASNPRVKKNVDTMKM